jgi:hypothetical protein
MGPPLLVGCTVCEGGAVPEAVKVRVGGLTDSVRDAGGVPEGVSVKLFANVLPPLATAA